MFWIVFIIASVALIIFLPIYLQNKSNKAYQERLEVANNKARENHVIDTEGYTLAIENRAVHRSGLPATGNEICTITVKSKEIAINSPRQEFKIPMDRVIGAVVNKETRDIQNVQYSTKKSPSIGKAVVGGALFGPAGAIIGGTSGKSKTTSNVQTRTEVTKLYLTINYTSGGEHKELIFEGSPYCRFNEVQNNINAYASNGGTYTL